MQWFGNRKKRQICSSATLASPNPTPKKPRPRFAHSKTPGAPSYSRKPRPAEGGIGPSCIDCSLKDLLVILERIDASEGKFRSLTESIDTSGPAGRMMMQMLGSFAEFEREMIRERTRAGLLEASAQGRVPGRKPKITSEQENEIVEAVSSGRKTPAETARWLTKLSSCASFLRARVGVPLRPKLLNALFREDSAMIR